MSNITVAQNQLLEIVSTDDLLTGNAVYTSDIIYVAGNSRIIGMIFSDQSSAAGGLVIEQAQNSADFASGYVTRSTQSYTGNAVTSNTFAITIVAPFARIKYTNGATPQGIFRFTASAISQ